MTVLNRERLLEVTVPERDLFLAKEIRNRRGELYPRGERDGAERIVRRDDRVVRLGDARDQARFQDAARVTKVGLENGRRVFLQDFTKAPLGENALARRDGQVRAARDLGHYVHVLALARFLAEHR